MSRRARFAAGRRGTALKFGAGRAESRVLSPEPAFMSALLPPTVVPFDPAAERVVIASTLLRSAGRLMFGRDERSVVTAVCRTLTQASAHIPVAWTWFGPVDAEYIVPELCAGRAADYARTLVIRRSREPVPRLAPASPFDVPPAALYGPWRQAAERHGIRHALSLALPSGLAGQGGIFVVYADLPDYFQQVGTTVFEALAEVLGSVLTLAAERKELERPNFRDDLTGLLSRSAERLVAQRLARDAELAAKSSLILVDMDNLKRIHAERGRGAAEHALRAVAQALRRALRRGDEALRWDDEAFLVLLPGSPRAQALRAAEKLRRAVQEGGLAIGLTCSAGVVELAEGEALGDAVLRAAAAVFTAKAAGQNRVQAG